MRFGKWETMWKKYHKIALLLVHRKGNFRKQISNANRLWSHCRWIKLWRKTYWIFLEIFRLWLLATKWWPITSFVKSSTSVWTSLKWQKFIFSLSAYSPKFLPSTLTGNGLTKKGRKNLKSTVFIGLLLRNYSKFLKKQQKTPPKPKI